MKIYKDDFYTIRHDNTKYSAHIVLSLIKKIIPEFTSAIDFGCGVGTWLNVGSELGAKDIYGVEGNWVNHDLLMIPEERFIEKDFGTDFDLDLNKKFDLAISLEVAEHLPNTSSKAFVNLLTGHSDFVLFSAAIPFQGGKGHVNEQWPDYWIDIFSKKGYTAYDVIRKEIWNDDSIPHWYRKNTLLYVKNERIKDLNLNSVLNTHVPPEIYLLSFQNAISPKIKHASYLLYVACKRRLKRNLGKIIGKKY